MTKSRILQSLALAGVLLLARSADAAVLTAYGVDSTLGGSMAFSGVPVVDYGSGTVSLTAEDTSGSQSYDGVAFTEFFYPTTAEAAPTPTGNGFSYLNNGSWSPGVADEQLNVTGASLPYSLQVLDPTQIDVPLTDSLDGYTAGPLVDTDTVPLIQLGNFTPGQSKSFTINFSEVNPPFSFASDSFFVAVPEPSSIVLGLLALAGALAFCGRRCFGPVCR